MNSHQWQALYPPYSCILFDFWILPHQSQSRNALQEQKELNLGRILTIKVRHSVRYRQTLLPHIFLQTKKMKVYTKLRVHAVTLLMNGILSRSISSPEKQMKLAIGCARGQFVRKRWSRLCRAYVVLSKHHPASAITHFIVNLQFRELFYR